MKFKSYFKSFLDATVNLNPTRISLLDSRVESITKLLKESDKYKDYFIDTIPQGSYAHKTIIKPVKDNDEFDADLLFFIEEIPEYNAKDYVEELYNFFKDNKTYEDMVHRKTRCITLDYEGDFHIDIVPYLDRHEEKFVTNRHENRYELTNPERFNEWLDEKNRTAKYHFIKIVRLVKYLRDYKDRFSVKSIILSTLIGQQINDAALLENPGCYSDVPTTLYTAMKKLKGYLDANPNMPSILDPGDTGENFSDRWNQKEYSNFRTWIIFYTEKIVAAYEESNKEKSLAKWQEVFGSDFKKPVEESADKSKRELSGVTSSEQQLSDLNIISNIIPQYKITLEGRVIKRNGFRDYKLSKSGNKVERGRDILFEIINCNVPEPFKIYWKVLNRGEEAIKHNCIRGQIIEGSFSRNESTTFSGPHYVDCYIVKDGFCVAQDRQYVSII